MGQVVEVTFCRHEVPGSELLCGYYGYDCPLCGTLVYPYGSAPWDAEEGIDDPDDVAAPID